MRMLWELFNNYPDYEVVPMVSLLYVACGTTVFYITKIILDRMQIFGESYFSVTIIGTTLSLNAVLLIFVLIQSISTFQKVQDVVNNELKSLYVIDKEITPLSSRAIDQIKPFYKEYLESVISSEWLLMPTNLLDEKTEYLFDDFVSSLVTFTPQSNVERQIKSELVPMTKEAAAARYLRIKSRGTALSSAFFYSVLLLQGLFVIHFALLTRRDIFSQCALLIYQINLGLLLGLIVIYDHPFQGDSGIKSDYFLPMLERINNLRGSEYR